MKSLLVITVALLMATTAHADVAVAKRAYEKGLVAYNLQQFGDALDLFRHAYQERQDPAFLFNIGQCQRQLGRFDEAAKSYRAYLSTSPEAPANADQVRALIADMDVSTRRPPPPVTTPPPITPAPPAVAVSVVETPPAPVHSMAGWALTSGGIAIAGAGAGLLGYSSALRDDAQSATTVALQEHDNERSGTMRVAGAVMLGAGLAVTLGGVAAFGVASYRYHHRTTYDR